MYAPAPRWRTNVTSPRRSGRVRSSSTAAASTSPAPAITIGRRSVATAQLLDDRRHVRRLDVGAVPLVDRDDRRPAAAAEALDRAQRELAVLGRLPGRDSQFLLERLEHLLRPDE